MPLLPDRAEVDRSRVDEYPLLPGELERDVLPNVVCACGKSARAVVGRLRLTNFRLTFAPDVPLSSSSSFQLPLPAIARVARDGPQFVIASKDLRVLRLNVEHARHPIMKETSWLRRSQWLHGLAQQLQAPTTPEQLFAFAFGTATPSRDRKDKDHANGWRLYSALKEYRRLGFFPTEEQQSEVTEWRLIRSPDFRFSPTYPSLLVAPKSISTTELQRAVGMHTHARLPVAVWRHPVHKCVLVRSAAPGKAWAESSVAAAMHWAFRHSVQLDGDRNEALLRPLYVFDTRKATGRRKRRAESGDGEDYTHVEFLGIANAHKMRGALSALQALVTSCDLDDNDDDYFTRLGKTGWLQQVARVLAGAERIARVMNEVGASVVVVSKNGWDRAPLLASLAQLMLDPYYRTIRGFAVLVEKEWCSFSHKFTDRWGVGKDAKNQPNERAPVMLLFLDCVWQLTRQFPTAFEFNATFLLHIWDALLSGLYGTFLYNTERERVAAKVREQTESVWTPVLQNLGPFQNFAYQAGSETLYPRTGVRHMAPWDDLFLRWDPANRESVMATPSGAYGFCRLEHRAVMDPMKLLSFGGGNEAGFELVRGELTVL